MVLVWITSLYIAEALLQIKLSRRVQFRFYHLVGLPFEVCCLSFRWFCLRIASEYHGALDTRSGRSTKWCGKSLHRRKPHTVFPRLTQNNDNAADLVAVRRILMTTMADLLGVSRSNLPDRRKGKSKPRGPYLKAEDVELLPAIRRLVDCRPTATGGLPPLSTGSGEPPNRRRQSQAVHCGHEVKHASGRMSFTAFSRSRSTGVWRVVSCSSLASGQRLDH